jgi:ferredoxin/flavodoxin---NADP+ reductase
VIGTEANPLRVAIVGSGPAGFYTAEHILKHEGTHAEVDMFDRLPTPYGLVRFGVAPDHPKIKSVIRVYEKTAARPEFRFFGNVEVGTDVTVDELRERYHAVVFAYGTATDRQLGIPGEELAGSHPATEFVNWYNAHPDFADREFDLSCERVVVIGNGNVAADVARMLALTADELAETDTADHAIEAFNGAAVREIVVLGRRGPAQAAFTNPEVRELGEMAAADIDIDPAEMELDELSREWLDSDDADPTNRRNVDIFTDFSQRDPEGKPKKISLRFMRSPVEIQGDGKVERIVVAKNELQRDDSGRIRAVDTGERETIECGLVLRPGPRRRRDAVPRPLCGGLDQARSLRRDRHQQEGRAGDGGQPLRRSRGREHPRAGARGRPRLDRGAAERAQARPRHLRGLAGDRRRRGRGRQAARPAPREALQGR